MGLIIALLLIAAVLFLLFYPGLKGWRTLVLGWFTAVFGAGLPIVTQLTEYAQTLDWRQYVLSFNDWKNFLVLVIPAVLGGLIIILRYNTTGPVGQK